MSPPQPVDVDRAFGVARGRAHVMPAHARFACAEGGEQGPCGWLKDRFGVSWQVVPSMITEWLTSTDTAARDRAFQAVMTMKKLDIAAIRAAFAGKI